MCGICGYVGGREPDRLRAMLRKLVHRGPDEEGQHEESGVGLGVRRLRVIDPEGGRQPVSNERGTVWAVLNGEIYNFLELREELTQKGHRFTSRCDSEVLVHLYEEEGIEGVHRLQGMFGFALWDREQDTIFLVRDRLGIKPLYYAVHDQVSGGARLFFSSELPSLLAGLPRPRIRPQAIVDYLTLLYVPAPDTVYEGIFQLRPGEYVKFCKGTLTLERYWRLKDMLPRRKAATTPQAMDEALGLLRDTVRAHLISDVPLGVFLSGGLDSGTILAMMRQISNGPIRTFSIGYDAVADQSYNELDAARRLAAQFGADHTEERLSPDVVSLLPRIVEQFGEPFADSSAIPTYLVSEVARRSVTVALSGIGGDELFGGYPRYLGIRAAAAYERVPASIRTWIGRSLASRLRETGGGRDNIGRIKRFLSDGHRSLPEQYVQWTTHLPMRWGGDALTAELRDSQDINQSYHALEWLFQSWPVQDPVDQAMGVDLQTYLPDDLLRMGDRMSMAHSLELRVPFCDHILLALAAGIPSSVRLSRWRLKGFLRDVLRPVLPSSVVEGPKFGFRIPLARWLRHDLREMIRDLLSDETVARRRYVNPRYVDWLIREHESGRSNQADQLYALVVLELWHLQQEQQATVNLG